jgi:GAF domain-containing protein
MRGKGAHTATFTGDLALACDERQYERGHGPCLDASVTAATLLIDDMKQETRWRDYTPGAVEAGARSSLSIGLPVHESVTGALNIYATEPDIFHDDAVVLAQTFAASPGALVVLIG